MTRRSVIGTTAALGGAAALAACGSSGGSSGGTTTAGASSAASSSPTASATTSAGSATSTPAATPSGTVLAKTADVPVGGGVLVKDQKVVVVQATAGRFTAVSAVCTHRGCTVQAPADGVIHCKCHGSQYGLDGSVKQGPADQPLAAVPVVAAGGEVRKE